MGNAVHMGARLTDVNSAAVPLVLLVDRDFETRSLYRHSLMAARWRVDESDDGRDALVKVLDRHPALVVTEIRLPYIDGYQLCHLLRQDPETCDVHIVVLTGDAAPEQLTRARRAGADLVLVKPCLPDQLDSELRRLTRESRDLRSRSEAARERASAQLSRSSALIERGHRTLVRAHARFETTTPALTPPELRCPICDRPLRYERSHIGGVSSRHPEQWDYLTCSGTCGTFQYRHRTRKLRRVT
jgi:two-component system, cell cycle response regulator DivK